MLRSALRRRRLRNLPAIVHRLILAAEILIICFGLAVVLLSLYPGCAFARHRQDDSATNKTAVRQNAGGSAINLSPTMSVSGAGNLLQLAIILTVLRSWVREKKATTQLIRAIETTNAGDAKRLAEHNTHACGLGSWFHKRVKRTLRQ